MVSTIKDSARNKTQNRDIEIGSISPSSLNPRKHFDQEALQELADSIREHTLLEPIVVRALEGNRYEIIAGERRWRAANIACLEVVPCRKIGRAHV